MTLDRKIVPVGFVLTAAIFLWLSMPWDSDRSVEMAEPDSESHPKQLSAPASALKPDTTPDTVRFTFYKALREQNVVVPATTRRIPKDENSVVSSPKRVKRAKIYYNTHTTITDKKPVYTLQVASFSDFKKAAKQIRQLQNRGIRARIHTDLIHGKRVYRVHIGPYATQSAVRQAAERLN